MFLLKLSTISIIIIFLEFTSATKIKLFKKKFIGNGKFISYNYFGRDLAILVECNETEITKHSCNLSSEYYTIDGDTFQYKQHQDFHLPCKPGAFSMRKFDVIYTDREKIVFTYEDSCDPKDERRIYNVIDMSTNSKIEFSVPAKFFDFHNPDFVTTTQIIPRNDYTFDVIQFGKNCNVSGVCKERRDSQGQLLQTVTLFSDLVQSEKIVSFNFLYPFANGDHYFTTMVERNMNNESDYKISASVAKPDNVTVTPLECFVGYGELIPDVSDNFASFCMFMESTYSKVLECFQFDLDGHQTLDIQFNWDSPIASHHVVNLSRGKLALLIHEKDAGKFYATQIESRGKRRRSLYIDGFDDGKQYRNPVMDTTFTKFYVGEENNLCIMRKFGYEFYRACFPAELLNR